MTKAEVDAALERRAAEVMGFIVIPDGADISPHVDSCIHAHRCPNYCSPDVPHSTLRGLLAKLIDDDANWAFPQFWNEMLLSVRDRKTYGNYAILTAPPRQIVAACLAALDKLPDGITLKMVRDTEGEG